MNDAEISEKLKGWARAAFPQSMNNRFAMSDWCGRILDFMKAVPPSEYEEVYLAVYEPQKASGWPGDVMDRLRTLYGKLDDEGMYVQANTVALAMDEIERLRRQSAA